MFCDIICIYYRICPLSLIPPLSGLLRLLSLISQQTSDPIPTIQLKDAKRWSHIPRHFYLSFSELEGYKGGILSFTAGEHLSLD